MADSNEDFQSQEDEDPTSEQGEEESSDESSDAEDGKTQEESERDDLVKRLQSERDKATAKANKLEKQVEKQKAASASGKSKTEVPAEVEQWITAAKGNARKSLFESHPSLVRHQVDPALIVGETPEEMTESAEALAKFVVDLETRVRGTVLEEHGFDPEPRSSSAPGRKDYKSMGKDDFDKLVEEALRG